MGLFQRFSLINKQWPKPKKSRLSTTTTTLPTTNRSVSTSSIEESIGSKVEIVGTQPCDGLDTPLPSLVRSMDTPPFTKNTMGTKHMKTTTDTSPLYSSMDTKTLPLEILITGTFQVDISTVIRLAFDDVRPVRSKHKVGHVVQTKLTVDDTTYDLELVKMDTTDIVKNQGQSDQVYNDLERFDGAIVCYDINNDASSDSLVDLFNALTRWKRPIFLVALNTDMTQCTIDQQQQLENHLAASFKTPSIIIDIYTPNSEMQMRKVYSDLVQEILQLSSTKPTHHHLHPDISPQQQSTSKRISRPASFISISPETQPSTLSSSSSSSLSLERDNHEATRLPRSQHRYDLPTLASLDDNTPSLHDPRTGYLTPPLSPIQPVPTCIPGPSLTSSDPGYTVANIVNELTFWDYHDQDTLTMIFLTFYRKFMTPYQLLQSLIERFEQDYECDYQPTRIQERIRTILCLWLSHQWCDFYYGRSYHTIHRFLQRLGNNQDLSGMYHLLAPLITRPGPMADPDTMWGMTDDETDDTSLSNSNSFYGLWANSPSITTMLSMSSSLDDEISDRHHSLSSAASLDWYKEANLHHPLTTTTTTTIPTHITNTLSSRSSNSSSRPTLSTTSSVYSQDTTLKSHSSSNKNEKNNSNNNNSIHQSLKRNLWNLPRGNTDEPAIFGGGLMLLEATGRRPFSLNRLQSSLRHKSHNRYAMLMNLPVDLLAEQLTWAELTIYRNIKPRDYIRHLWGEKGASEAMMASISHGNFIKGWVVTMILIQSHHGKRVALLNKFIDLAYRLYQDHHNYNTLAPMLQGLTQILDKQPQWMDQAKAKQLKQLVTLMQDDRNFALYRQDLGDSNDGSSIPYLRVHRQDIVTIAETQRDVTIGGGVHWEKFKIMGKIILQLTQAGSLATTTTQPNPFVLAFLSDTSLLTEKERICRLDDLREK